MKLYYEILGVPPDADSHQIKRAFRDIAKKWHPDKCPDDPTAQARFQQAQEAYQLLSNPESRRAYDRQRQPVASVQDLFRAHEAGRKVLETMLPSAPAAPKRGMDLCQVVPVSTELLIDGGSIPITIERKGQTAETIPLTIPAQAHTTPWCCLHGRGEPGKNSGPDGDLWVCLVERKPEV